jgi:hypothetical protein
MQLGCFEEEKCLLPLSRIKAVFCSYADGKVASVGNLRIVARTGIDLDVNADKTKYMVMSRDQNTGQSHNTGR